MVRVTKGYSIVHVEPPVGKISKSVHMVGLEMNPAISAYAASKVIAHKHRNAPVGIFITISNAPVLGCNAALPMRRKRPRLSFVRNRQPRSILF